mgnify:CR=1 FL=1
MNAKQNKMRTKGNCLWVTLMGIVLCASAGTVRAADVFMDDIAGGNGTGTSWENACRTWAEVSTALNNNDTLHVKEGIYTNGAAINLTETPITVQGGYPQGNTGTDTTGRAPATYASILNSDGTYRVLTLQYSQTWDGFTIQGGGGVTVGAGVYITAGSGATVELRNCTIQNNSINQTTTADNQGGAGVHVTNVLASVTLRNCAIRNNTMTTTVDPGNSTGGGGLMARTFAGATLTVENCSFSNNTFQPGGTYAGAATVNGGGAVCVGRNATFKACVFSSNSAVLTSSGSNPNQRFGGGAVFLLGAAYTANFDRCHFLGNSCTVGATTSDYQGGGALLAQPSNITPPAPFNIINVTNSYFYNNSSNTHGSAIDTNAFWDANGRYVNWNITHCTFDSNVNAASRETIWIGRINSGDSNSCAKITNCLFFSNTGSASYPIQRLAASTNPYDAVTNPLFFGNTNDSASGITPSGTVTGDPLMSAGSYAIGLGSAAINAGAVIAGFQNDIQTPIGGESLRTDAAGNNLDIGCDEYGYVPVNVSAFAVE